METWIVAIVVTQENNQGHIEKWEAFDDYYEAWEELVNNVTKLHNDLGGPHALYYNDFNFGQSIHYTFVNKDGDTLCAQIV